MASCDVLASPVGRPLTFEDNLQVISQDVKGAVSGAGLGDDVFLQPAPAGILIEVLTRVHAGVHVLDKAGGWVEGKRIYKPFRINYNGLSGAGLSVRKDVRIDHAQLMMKDPGGWGVDDSTPQTWGSGKSQINK